MSSNAAADVAAAAPAPLNYHYPPLKTPPLLAYGWLVDIPPPRGPYLYPCVPPDYQLVKPHALSDDKQKARSRPGSARKPRVAADAMQVDSSVGDKATDDNAASSKDVDKTSADDSTDAMLRQPPQMIFGWWIGTLPPHPPYFWSALPTGYHLTPPPGINCCPQCTSKDVTLNCNSCSYVHYGSHQPRDSNDATEEHPSHPSISSDDEQKQPTSERAVNGASQTNNSDDAEMMPTQPTTYTFMRSPTNDNAVPMPDSSLPVSQLSHFPQSQQSTAPSRFDSTLNGLNWRSGSIGLTSFGGSRFDSTHLPLPSLDGMLNLSSQGNALGTSSSELLRNGSASQTIRLMMMHNDSSQNPLQSSTPRASPTVSQPNVSHEVTIPNFLASQSQTE